MTESPFRRNNHYVSMGYLKRWCSQEGRLWVYRILVSHPNIPLWKYSSTRGLAYHTHLYTRLLTGSESDEIERWLDHDFETPAEEPLHKATSGSRLTPQDWKRLIRFVAAQHVRTPARLIENLERWKKQIPDIMESTIQESIQKLEEAHRKGLKLESRHDEESDYIPLRVSTERDPTQDGGILKVECIVGRGMWLYSIKHLLTKIAAILEQHKWTILSPPDDVEWITSDDPVICLNYYGPSSYDFRGGWNNPGTEILLPISPRHLIYTKVGNRTYLASQVSKEIAKAFRLFIVEHAHRYIFTSSQDNDVPNWRPRIVSSELFEEENEQWRRWHEEQTNAERKLRGLRERLPLPANE